MDFKGVFTSNNISMPQWRNKDGSNEFEKVLNRLADMGKKITMKTIKKSADEQSNEQVNADKPVQEISTTPSQEGLISGVYQDSRPRPLGEIFNNNSRLAERAICKAREIIGERIAKLNCPASDVYYLKSDITRTSSDGTPATGRISFQIPFMTPQGDQRTVYADVDIIMGSLMPPRQFYDSMNQRFAFTNEGLKEYLGGRDFEVLNNPKVQPETVYFETPGHLAGKGDMVMIKHAVEETSKVSPTELVPGTADARVFDELENVTDNISELTKRVKKAKEDLDAVVAEIQEGKKYKSEQKALKDAVLAQKATIESTEIVLNELETDMIKVKGKIYKKREDIEYGRQPVFTQVVGGLLKLFPKIRSAVDGLWQDMRTMTSITSLERTSPEGDKKKWEMHRDAPVQPEGPKYESPKFKPPTESGDKFELKKVAGMIDNLTNLVQAVDEIVALVDEAGM